MKKIVVVLALVMLVSCFTGCMAKKVEFEVSDFDLEHEKSDYSEKYEGSGEVETDAKGNYLVLISYEKDGGSGKDEGIITVLVHDGDGEFVTYDSSYSLEEGEELEKPDYEFEIIGYTEFITTKEK